MTKRKICKDCVAEGVGTRRKATYPGPRCATHHRQHKKHAQQRRRATRLKSTYGITIQQYQALYEAQGGVCCICRRATGRSKALAVDHDHKTGYVRGLLCSTCNRKIVGHLRDDPEAFERGKQYLLNPPAFEVIGKVKPN